MTVLIDGTGINLQKTGVSQYIISLLEKLVALDRSVEYKIIVNIPLSLVLLKNLASKENVRFYYEDIPALGIKRDLKYFGVARKYLHDVFHCMNSNLPAFMGDKNKTLVTIHDLKYLIFPKYLGKRHFLKYLYLKMVFKRAFYQTRKIIAVSHSTKSDILSQAKIREDKIKVIYEACNIKGENSRAAAKHYDLEKPYFLYVGELRPHKNVDGLVRGFQIFNRENAHSQVSLLVAGKLHRSYKWQDHDGTNVVFCGYVPDEDLYTLYQKALGFCLVSFYEGFGLPILEAMHAGTPVITSDRSATKEIAGSAALLVNPDSPEQIAAAMEKIFHDPHLRGTLIARGKEREKGFTWEKAAAETLSLYKEIGTRGKNAVR